MTSSRRLRTLRRIAPAAALALLAGAAAACGDPLGPRANFETFAASLVVYALSDDDPSRRDFPTALLTTAQASGAGGGLVFQPRLTTPSAAADFDVAFDINAAGQAVLIPQRRLVPGSGGRSVGILTSSQPFDALTEAPRSGYTFDTAAVAVNVGQTVVLQAQTSLCFNDSRGASPFLFSKLVVDSVQSATRSIFFRIVVNPNCGFRSFRSGVPED